jgi:cell division protein ZapA
MNEQLDPNLIQIEIFGQVYKVRGEEDQGYIEELARYVDSKMQTISETTGTIDSLKVAILAALNIADELFKLQSERESSEERVLTKANELADALDEALKEEDISEPEEARDALS